MRFVRSALVTAFAGLSAISAAGCAKQRTTVAEVDALIDKRIARGSSPQQVAAVLDTLKIDHATYNSTTKSLRAIMRKTSQSAMVEGWMQIEFAFDQQDRLVRHTVKEGFTGP